MPRYLVETAFALMEEGFDGGGEKIYRKVGDFPSRVDAEEGCLTHIERMKQFGWAHQRKVISWTINGPSGYNEVLFKKNQYGDRTDDRRSTSVTLVIEEYEVSRVAA